MKNKIMIFALCLMCAGLTACGTDSVGTASQQSAAVTATENVTEAAPAEATQSEETQPEKTEAAQPEVTEAAQAEENDAVQSEETEAPQADENGDSAEQGESAAEPVTAKQAIDAVKNYCMTVNPDLKSMMDSDEYTMYWDVTSTSPEEIVVLYRSYTGAQVRYYIDPASGDTYVTEMVPGIMDEEQRTEESFNIRDYFV